MSSRRLALFGLLALGACGFTPVFGVGNLRGTVEIATPATVAGYALGTALITRFGTADDAMYLLSATLSESQSVAAQTIDGDSTRFDLNGTSDWTLSKDEMIIASGTAKTFTSYSATGSTLATQTAERGARDRLSVALADIIIADVILATK